MKAQEGFTWKEAQVPSLTCRASPRRARRQPARTPAPPGPPSAPRPARSPGGRQGGAPSGPIPVRPDARPAWSGPCRPRVAAAGGRARAGGGGSYLDQLLRGQPRAGGGRRRGLRGRGRRRRVVVRVLELLAGEERRVAGRVRGAQHGLELREHGLVLRGRRLGRGAQAGAHGQHPRGHGGARGAGSGREARIGRALRLAHAGWGRRARRGAAGADGRLRGDPSTSSSQFPRARTQSKTLPLRHASTPVSSGGHFLPPRPSALSASPEPAPASADRHERAASARTCPRLLTLDARLYFTQLSGGGTRPPE